MAERDEDRVPRRSPASSGAKSEPVQRCCAVKPVRLKASMSPVYTVHLALVDGDDIPVPNETGRDFNGLHR